ncbi:MAG: hypothetical protein WA705_07765 [Candidatus Ozemobacteraceae bacterium]
MTTKYANAGFALKMKRRNAGFTLFLAFMVTTVLFLLVIGASDLARADIDLSRSTLLETAAFHAADGGLERGLARLRMHPFAPFQFTYTVDLGGIRLAEVRVKAIHSTNSPHRGGLRKSSSLDLFVEADIREGGRMAARKKLSRKGVLDLPGRQACGHFSEES